MSDENDEGIPDDEIEHARDTKWAILFCEQTGEHVVTKIDPGSEIGEYEMDMSKVGRDWRVTAFFDSNVEGLLKAITLLGGNSIEVNLNVTDLLMGVIRSFEEAKIQHERWRVEKK